MIPAPLQASVSAERKFSYTAFHRWLRICPRNSRVAEASRSRLSHGPMKMDAFYRLVDRNAQVGSVLLARICNRAGQHRFPHPGRRERLSSSSATAMPFGRKNADVRRKSTYMTCCSAKKICYSIVIIRIDRFFSIRLQKRRRERHNNL